MRCAKMMAVPSAAAFAAFLVSATPAFAAYGALAHEETGGKYGLSSNQETETKAEEAALKSCGADKCKIVFRTTSRECGAIATAETGTAWGAGKRPQRAAAELDAIQNCQKRTKGQCKVRATECNR